MSPLCLFPIAQTLPDDVLGELYKMCAKLDPPLRMHLSCLRPLPISSIRRPDAPTATLAPSWSVQLTKQVENTMPEGFGSKMFEIVSTERLANKRSFLGWIRLTHVCTHWRTVGLSLARLWADIFSVFPHVADVFLARSGDAPLSLDMDLIEKFATQPVSPIPLSFLYLAQQQLARARVLTFPRGLGANWHPNLIRGIQLPYLESLRVYLTRWGTEFPDLTLHAPALTCLVLDTFIPSLAKPSLRYLKISKAAGPINQALLLSLLRCTPMLEELILEFARASEAEGHVLASSTTSAIPLSMLSTAHLSGDSPSLTFVEYLNIPDDTELSFDVGYNSSILPLLDVLSTRLRNTSIDCMSVDPGPSVDICLGSTRASTDKPVPRILVKIPLSCITEELGSLSVYYAQFLARMVPANIVSFHANSYTVRYISSENDDPFQYASVLRELAGLKTLSMSWLPERYQPFLVASGLSSAPEALETVVVFSEDSLAAYDHRLLFPRIVVPAIEGVRRRWQDISQMLSQRAKHEQPVKRLILKGLRSEDAAFRNADAWALLRISKLVNEVVDERNNV